MEGCKEETSEWEQNCNNARYRQILMELVQMYLVIE